MARAAEGAGGPVAQVVHHDDHDIRCVRRRGDRANRFEGGGLVFDAERGGDDLGLIGLGQHVPLGLDTTHDEDSSGLVVARGRGGRRG